MANVNKWSKTFGTNASVDSDINFAEGQAPSSVNNSNRAVMASVANDRDDTRGALTTSGTQPSYSLSTNSTNVSLQNGLMVSAKIHASATGSITLNVDNLGAKKVFDNGSAITSQLGNGGLTINEVATFVYQSTLDSGNGGWVKTSNPGTTSTANLATISGGSWSAEVTIASAATTDVLGQSSYFVAISGNATITSLGTGPNKFRIVRAAGAFTLTHNATTLILEGGVSRTFAAGDIFFVESDSSSNCRVFSVSSNDGRQVKAFTGDSGSGGVIGLVPAPAAGDASAGKFLAADGTWSATTSTGTWIPTVASASGALTLVQNRVGTYYKIGSVVQFRVTFDISSNGTGAGAIDVGGFPFTMSGQAAVYGVETSTNKGISGVPLSTTSHRIRFSDATYPGANGASFVLMGTAFV